MQDEDILFGRLRRSTFAQLAPNIYSVQSIACVLSTPHILVASRCIRFCAGNDIVIVDKKAEQIAKHGQSHSFPTNVQLSPDKFQFTPDVIRRAGFAEIDWIPHHKMKQK